MGGAADPPPGHIGPLACTLNKIYLTVVPSLAVLALAACGDATPTVANEPGPNATSTPTVDDSWVGQDDFGNDIRVTYDDHRSLGRVVYLTHVQSGSHIALDERLSVVARFLGSAAGDALLDDVLADTDMRSRLSRGLSYEGSYQETSIDGPINFIRFDGTFFLAKGSTSFVRLLEEEPVTSSALGPIIFRVVFRHDGHVAAGNAVRDGDAAYLDPGTPVHEITGYAPRFRLGTLQFGKVTVFEADSNPHAQFGADLFDIDGRVSAIAVLGTSGQDEIGRIDDEDEVRRLVSLVLASKVELPSTTSGDSHFIAFWMADGTAVVRPYARATGRLARGVMTPPAFQEAIARVIPAN